MKSNLISVNHPYAATSDILILFAALFIQIVALYLAPARRDVGHDEADIDTLVARFDRAVQFSLGDTVCQCIIEV